MVDGKNRKAYLIAFIDDMSRLVCHAQFYLSENLNSYLDALRQALEPAACRANSTSITAPPFVPFISTRSLLLSASLSSTPSPISPRAKVRSSAFSAPCAVIFSPTVNAKTLSDLNTALDRWLRDLYHNREHRSTGQSPLARYAAHCECVRAAPKDLSDHFRQQARRRVAKDRSVALAGRLFGLPSPLIGKQISLFYHPHDIARVEARYEGKSYGMLHAVDLNVNCQVKREKDTVKIHTQPRPLSRRPTPLGRRQGATIMMRHPLYRSFFGFVRDPFTVEINADEIFTTPALTHFTERFDYVLRLGAIGLLTGEVGAGKSTALRFAASRLHPSQFQPLWIIASSGSILETYRQLAAALGTESRQVFARGSLSGHSPCHRRAQQENPTPGHHR